jgi:hypothetical protein
MIRRTLLGFLAVVAVGAVTVSGSNAVLEVFRAQSELEKRLLAADLVVLEKMQGQLRAACDRMMRLGDDLLRAEKESEDSGSFASRSADLRRAEVEVADLTAGAQQLRMTIATRRALVEQLDAEIGRLEEVEGDVADELSGRWSVILEPGGQKGSFDLKQDGTLVSGVYLLAGGFRGSLRGTFIGSVVRLERIDAEKGFMAILTARLVGKGNDRRFEGVWEATNLAAGLPSNGSWVGRRESK